MEMQRVGVISDTHISDRRRVIPAAVWQAFADVDCILHAGDIARQDVLDELAALAPVHAVYGNMDPPELASTLKSVLVLDLDGARIGLTHGHLGRGRTTPQCALSLFTGVEGLRAVVFGHSHEPYNSVQRGVLLFNPGSPTERRRQPRPSYGFLTIEDGLVRGQIVYL
jgi:putative phosphoesterase